ncbi:hypothetical protein D9M69_670490 [compost metagenome]
MVEVITLIQPGDDRDFQYKAHDQRQCHGTQNRQHKRARGRIGQRPCIGAQHVQRAMGQIHEAHDSEHQRQTRCQQEQQHAVLQPVEQLFK